MAYRGSRADAARVMAHRAPPKAGDLDMQRINMDAMRLWVVRRLTALLGFEDDILCEMVTSFLEDERHPDRDALSSSIAGFLQDKTAGFVQELWRLLEAAQKAPAGIPPEFVEEKKRELAARRADEERMQARLRGDARSGS